MKSNLGKNVSAYASLSRKEVKRLKKARATKTRRADKETLQAEIETVMEWYNGNSCEDSWHLMKKYPKAWKELLKTE